MYQPYYNDERVGQRVQTVMDMGKETIITKGCRLVLDAFQFVGISSLNRIPNSRGVFKLRSN
jgi:hypothetical protein